MPSSAPGALQYSEISQPFAHDHVVDFVADLHLQASLTETCKAWNHYLKTTPAQTLFIMGDLFEVWIGDDVMDEAGSFEQQACQALQHAAQSMKIYFMHGNRDFLIGEHFSQQTGIEILHDPTAIQLGTDRYLLTHGDILCIDDIEYQKFRQLSRSTAWRQQFLQQPLAARRAFANKARNQSESRKSSTNAETYVDLDTPTSISWLEQSQCTTLLHGHTHKPADHALNGEFKRIVMSDWDLENTTPRAEALRWSQGQLQRIKLVP